MQSALVRWRMAGYDAKCRLADANVAVLAEQDKAYRSILAQLELNSRSVQRQWVAEHEHAVLVKERRLKRYDLAIGFERWKYFSRQIQAQQWSAEVEAEALD